ncbi:hypothetical protein [Alkalithermobacter paradoxus]|uniref:Uncharacterized protein n=1 Tax=Alkalithermobacter paradoxus TaxID=29349 RepID=A0A1V4I7Q7_9FIRM|nr:hypothetical protein CLOTH_11120 [[Clostridium] thermoalcaliphilum]
MYYSYNNNPFNIMSYYHSLYSRSGKNLESEYTDILRQGTEDIDKIINELEGQFSYMYTETSKLGLNNMAMRVLLRFIVRYTLDNANKYKGSIEERSQRLLNDLRKDNPWIFFTLRAYGIPPRVIDQAVLGIISFVLSYIDRPSGIPVEVDKKAEQITNLIRQKTDIYTDLKGYGIPQRRIDNIVKSLVIFTIINIDLEDIYTNMEEKVRNILIKMQQSNLEPIKELQSYGVPMNQIRAILRTIIRFTIEHIESTEQSLEREAIRITNEIRNTTNIFQILRSYGVPQAQVPKVVKDIVYYTLQKGDMYKIPLDIQSQATEILSEMISTNQPVIRELRSYGIRINEIRPILRRIIAFTLRNKT